MSPVPSEAEGLHFNSTAPPWRSRFTDIASVTTGVATQTYSIIIHPKAHISTSCPQYDLVCLILFCVISGQSVDFGLKLGLGCLIIIINIIIIIAAAAAATTTILP